MTNNLQKKIAKCFNKSMNVCEVYHKFHGEKLYDNYQTLLTIVTQANITVIYFFISTNIYQKSSD